MVTSLQLACISFATFTASCVRSWYVSFGVAGGACAEKLDITPDSGRLLAQVMPEMGWFYLDRKADVAAAKGAVSELLDCVHRAASRQVVCYIECVVPGYCPAHHPVQAACAVLSPALPQGWHGAQVPSQVKLWLQPRRLSKRTCLMLVLYQEYCVAPTAL